MTKQFFIIRVFRDSLLPLIFFLFFGVSFFSGQHAHGAEFYFEKLSPVVREGDDFMIGLRLRSEGESLNAIQAELSITPNLSVLGIEDGGSIITIWNEHPRVPSNENSSLVFAGIIPGGYEGEDGSILRFKMRAKTAGPATVSLANYGVLKNDGLGSGASTTIKSLVFEIEPRFGSSTSIESQDRLPPEPFTPQISKDESIFEGRYFLTFHTADKQSGIDYYEVLEVSPTNQPPEGSTDWQTAESPYELKDQGLSSDIYVRAFDRAGNFIVTKLPAQNSVLFSKKSILPAMLLLGFLLVALVLYKGFLFFYGRPKK